MTIVTVVCLLAALPGLAVISHVTRHTSLRLAWWWLVLAAIVWIVGATVSAMRAGTPTLRDQLWYLAAVSLVCPLIAVLGARRPMARVWGAFILLPLVCVLSWPLFSSGTRRLDISLWSVEEPVLLGYVFVLIMGLGNYLPTRHGLAAVLWGLAGLLIVGAQCPATTPWLPQLTTACLLASICLAAASGLTVRQIRRSCADPADADPLDSVWREFRETFGIVWAVRVQERFNDQAARSRFGVRLSPLGLRPVTTAGEVVDQHGAEQFLHWLLRRFVDEEWWSKRLGTRGVPPGESPAGIGHDSVSQP